MVSAMAVLIVAGVGFTFAGAWPVTGFLGLDILLLVIAFRWSRRESERREHIRLDSTGLHIRSVDPNGRERNWRFERHWVRVHMDEPPRPGSVLTLQEGGRSLTLGQFLTPNERLELAKAIRAALHSCGRQTA